MGDIIKSLFLRRLHLNRCYEIGTQNILIQIRSFDYSKNPAKHCGDRKMVMQTFFPPETHKYQREVQIECYWKCGFLVGNQLASQNSVHRRFTVFCATGSLSGSTMEVNWSLLGNTLVWTEVRKAQSTGP